MDVFILEKEFKNLGLLGNLEPFNTTLCSNCILDMNFKCLNLFISDALKQNKITMQIVTNFWKSPGQKQGKQNKYFVSSN